MVHEPNHYLRLSRSTIEDGRLSSGTPSQIRTYMSQMKVLLRLRSWKVGSPVFVTVSVGEYLLLFCPLRHDTNLCTFVCRPSEEIFITWSHRLLVLLTSRVVVLLLVSYYPRSTALPTPTPEPNFSSSHRKNSTARSFLGFLNLFVRHFCRPPSHKVLLLLLFPEISQSLSPDESSGSSVGENRVIRLDQHVGST